MPFSKDQVTFFPEFTKLTEGNFALWAVGYVPDKEVVMTRLRARPDGLLTVNDVPDGLLAMVHLTRWGIGSLREEKFDFQKYAALQEVVHSTEEKIQIFSDKVRGALFGQAVGDALGFGTEFLSREEVTRQYPNGLNSYEQITRYGEIDNWCPGDWTDDTEQMLCILDSILAKKTIDIRDIAARIHHWATIDGMGMGRTVSAVVRTPGFLEDPIAASKKVWQDSGKQGAANGALMRSSVLGLWEFYDQALVEKNAETVSLITHHDPRCVGSCVVFCRAIATFLTEASVDIDQLIKDSIHLSQAFHPEIETYITYAMKDIESLDLDEGLNPGEEDRIGYTLKCLGAAFWALKHAESFEEGILQIIHEGGDADTNAAVAGALLGAKFGYSAIPKRLVDELVYYNVLDEKTERLARLSYLHSIGKRSR